MSCQQTNNWEQKQRPDAHIGEWRVAEHSTSGSDRLCIFIDMELQNNFLMMNDLLSWVGSATVHY